MTDEVKRSYEWLLSLASGKGFASYLIGMPEEAQQVADLIEALYAKLEEYETQVSGLEIMLTTAQSAAETWKWRAEAAEMDIHATCPCEMCDQTCKFNKVNADDPCGDFIWRGPCKEKGGTENVEAR